MSPARTSRARLLVVIAATAAAVAALALMSLTARPAHAQIDLTGDWNVTFDGIYFVEQVSLEVTQSGADLTIDLGFGDAQLNGTIDKGTGAFSVSGCPGDCLGLSMTGTTSPDGNSMSGSFSAGIGDSGSFTGTRKGAETATPTTTLVPPGSTPPPPVGGIAREPHVSALPAAAESRPVASGFAIAIAGATAGAVALGGAAWYARRRLLR